MWDKKRQLTPLKVVLVYLLAFGLVAGHEFDRLLGWVETVCLDRSCSGWTLDRIRSLQKTTEKLHLDEIIAAEERVLGLFQGGSSIGGSEAKIRLEGNTEPVQVSLAAPSPESAPVGPAGIPPPEEGAGLSLLEEKRPAKLEPRTVLIAGDSMILEGFGVALQRRLKEYQNLKIVREGVYSSGLARPDYFDWQPYLKELLDEHQSDLLILSLGANDPQDIVDEKGRRHFCATEGWNEIYAGRVRRLLETAAERGVLTFWVGLPIMANEKYGRKIANINAVVERECARRPDCHFVDTWLALADSENEFSTYREKGDGRHVRIRAKDGIHLTETGGRILTRHFLATASQFVQWPGEALEAEPLALAGRSDRPIFLTGRNRPETDGAGTALMSFFSRLRNQETSYYAFVPQADRGGAAFPVLYLLHGAWDDYTAWKVRAEDELKKAAETHRMIIVTPDGGRFGWYADSPFDPANQVESYFFKELIPHVEQALPVLKDRRAVAGLSMGGHGAMVLALRHPGAFMSVSAMSGILDLTRHRHRDWELDRVFGPYTQDNLDLWRQHSAYHLCLEKKDYLRSLPLLLTVAQDDPWALADNRLFHQRLTKLKIHHIYRESPGNHDWTYWKSQLPLHTAFHARVLNGQAAVK